MKLEKLPPFDSAEGTVNVIIDTPKWSRNKFSWDEELELFELAGVLPAGAIFPYNFGFIPGTKGGDGDPLDLLVIMDEPGFSGCLVRVRMLGVIEAEQTEEGKTNRNDRLIGAAVKSRTEGSLRTLQDLDENLVDEIEHFFVSYNAAKGKEFKALGRFGPERALELVRASIIKTDQ